MTGHYTGLAARICAEVSTLINVHCIMHREALGARNAAIVFQSFKCWIVLPTKFMSGWAIVQINATN